MGQHGKAAIGGISTEMKLWRTVSLMENKLGVVGEREDEKDTNETSTGTDMREKDEVPLLHRVLGCRSSQAYQRPGSSLR